jgi:UrcA family protein
MLNRQVQVTSSNEAPFVYWRVKVHRNAILTREDERILPSSRNKAGKMEDKMRREYQSYRSTQLCVAAGFFAAVMTLTVTSPAWADPHSPDITITGRALPSDSRVAYADYSDLDLTSDRGMATLNRRIKAAVETVCPVDSHLNLRAKADEKLCREDAYDQANLQIERVRNGRFAGRELGVAAQ